MAAEVTLPRRLVPAVDRAARLLDALHAARQPASLTDLAAGLQVNKATVLDILLTLRHHGLVARDPATKRFHLGPRLAQYAGDSRADWRDAVRGALALLSARSGETAVFGIEQGGRLVFLDAALGSGEFPLTVPVGRSLPLTATSLGKVLCAHLPAERVAAALAVQRAPGPPAGDGDARALWQQLDAVRQSGYALDRGDYAPGVFGLAAPVWGIGGLVGGIAVVGVLGRLDEAHLRRVRGAVGEAARYLEQQLGGTAHQEPRAGGH